MNRREFLISATAIPVLTCLRAKPAFADQPHHTPSYLALKPYITPENDEFPEEKLATQIVSSLHKALQSGELPLADGCKGASIFPGSHRALAPDLEEAVFDPTDSSVAQSWPRWIESLGAIRRISFYPLPDDVVRYEVASQNDGRLRYRVGQWKQSWSNGKLTSFSPLEEHIASAASPYFHDVTAAVFKNTPSFAEQLARGVPYWRARLDPATGIDIYGSNGIAVGDIDGDGLDEIYICQPGGLPNRLYKVRDDGSFADATEAWGVGILDDTSSALFLDLRNTGRQDLVVLRASGVPLLFLNDGRQLHLRTDAFHFVTTPQGAFTGMAAADFDRDGKLDLYLCCYVYFQSEAQYTYAIPYHDARNGPPNFLFRNRLNADGSGFFEDCTAETGMNENNDRFSFAPAWCDCNGDGWPDLYVANDFGRKNLYINHRGHFRDEAAQAGVDDIGPGMSATWFDYDNDGQPDLYVANMWTDAGQRIVHDPRFAPANTPATHAAYRGHTMGNTLFRNRGNGTFEDVTAPQQAAFGRWAWASGGHDFDNDGNAEILVTCGMLTNQSTTDLNGFFWRQVVAKSPVVAKPSSAYENGWNAINQFIREDYSWNGREPNVLHARRGDRYFDFSGVSGLDFANDSRAFSVIDFDQDGRPDLVVKSRLGPQVRVLQNNCAGANHSIAFQLTGTKSNRDAIGARVQVNKQTKWLDAGSGFLSQHSKRLIFGLGNSTSVPEVHIVWPSGGTQQLSNLRAGNTYFITEGSSNIQAKPFRDAHALPSEPVQADNSLALHDTWFMEPVPLPEQHFGPSLLLLLNGEPAPSMPGITVDFAKEPAVKREQYEIFRRYLFDWRAPLTTPLAILLNDAGHAAKIYGAAPSADQVMADLAKLRSVAPKDSLPFAGYYIDQPHRDFFKMGAAFLWSDYWEQALPYLEQVLRHTPENPRVLVLVGQIHIRANRLDAAEKCARDAASLNPSYAEAWSVLGDVFSLRDDFKQALASYQKALELKPDLFYTLLNAGRVADKLNHIPESETCYRHAVELDPGSAEAANGLGLALAKQGKADDARTYFEQAITLRRDYAEAINNLGVLYIQQGRKNDAIAAFRYGIQAAPDEDILYLNLGRLYLQQGRADQARLLMQQLLERKPDSLTARRALQELNGR